MPSYAVLLVGNEWKVSSHPTEATAQKHADDIGKFERGWIVKNKDGFTEGDEPITVDIANSIIAQLQPQAPPKFSADDVAQAIDYLWRLVARSKGSQARVPKKTMEDHGETTMADTTEKRKIKKVVPKSKKVAKATSPAKRASNGNGHAGRARGFGDAWNATLREYAKKGDVTMEQMKAIAEKHEVKPWFLRFVRLGVLAQVSRGVYRVTAEGKKRIGA